LFRFGAKKGCDFKQLGRLAPPPVTFCFCWILPACPLGCLVRHDDSVRDADTLDLAAINHLREVV
jgi:hypothetical protein